MPQTPIDLTQGFDLHDNESGIAHHVYAYGEGPPVILMHEITGMTPQFLCLAYRIASAGFRVYMPHFFGPVDKRDVSAGILFCLRHEFNVFLSDGKSPIASWLRVLCERADSECGGRGVGVIGLCLTGNIVMSAMVHQSVRLGVMCEPALPFIHAAALGVPESDVRRANDRAQIYPMLAYRFSTDTKCTHARFQSLRKTFGSGIHLTEICTGVDPWNIPNKSHSVLTQDYPNVNDTNHPVQHAIDEILTELRVRLNNTGLTLNTPTAPA
jgi:dienelactone hydrolase